MRSRVRPAGDDGFTLVEVLVAIMILLVGVLGAVSLVDGANAVTSKTKAREAGTNVARSVIEVSRSIRYRDLTAVELLDALSSRPGLDDAKPSQTGYTIESRNVDYEVTLTVCSLDDPRDNLGPHTGPVAYCADTDTQAAGDTTVDRNPDDYKRVRITLNWNTRGVGHSITQTSAIINPVGGLGPTVTSLTPMNVTDTDPILVQSSTLTHVDFHVTTSSSAQGVRWQIGGNPAGDATGAARNWDFTWDLNKPDGSVLYYDCTYVIQADAYDAQDRSGTPRSRTVILNRFAPVAPTGFGGGRNGSGDFVDLQWLQNPECDIRGYRVYRSNTAGTRGSAITCLAATTDITEKKECIDNPGAGTWYYTVVALDLPPGSVTPREGTNSPQITVNAAGTPPACADERPAVRGRRQRELPRRRGQPRSGGHGRGELGSRHGPGRRALLPDLPRRHGLRQSLRRVLPGAEQPRVRVARVRLVGHVAHLPRDRRGREVRGVRAQRPGVGRLAVHSLRRQDGFTLVEVLVVSVLMIVVLGATLTALNSFQKNISVNQKQNDAQDTARAGMDLMARDMRNLASPTRDQPLALDLMEAQNIVFQAEGRSKPAGSLNPSNTTRVRYCLAADRKLYRQVQTWESAAFPAIPSTSQCPGPTGAAGSGAWTTGLNRVVAENSRERLDAFAVHL